MVEGWYCHAAELAYAAEMTEEEKKAEEDAAAVAAAAEEMINEAAPYAPPEGFSAFEYEAEVHKMLDIVITRSTRTRTSFSGR